MSQKKPVVMTILDGWAMAPDSPGNAISLANTPNFDKLWKNNPHTLLGATGEDVGLDDNQMSGSEAGHMNIGAGRIVTQDSHYITKSIEKGDFFENPVLVGAMRHAKVNNGKLHVMGLMSVSDSPHSNPEHFRAVLKLAKKKGIGEVYCHLFSDGRDSYPYSGLEILEKFKTIMKEEGIGKIASISGRFYAMDRAKNWKRLTKAFDTIVFSRGEKAKTPEKIFENSYEKEITDEYILPTYIEEDGVPVAKIEENDSVIFYNLRSDRARQFSKLFVAANKNRILEDDMPIIDQVKNLYFVAMTDFGPDLNIHTAFPDETIKDTLPIVLREKRQLYIAENEKFAHVTYFFNGGYADPVGGEERVVIPSIKADTYIEKPEMSAREVADYVVKKIENDEFDFITVNFANTDMVAHTGNLQATVKAAEAVDEQLGRIKDALFEKQGTLIVTADHGNADEMIDIVDGEKRIHTFHTKNPVPFILAGKGYFNVSLSQKGVLGNIAPTILEVLGIEKPKRMNLESLIER